MALTAYLPYGKLCSQPDWCVSNACVLACRADILEEVAQQSESMGRMEGNVERLERRLKDFLRETRPHQQPPSSNSVSDTSPLWKSSVAPASKHPSSLGDQGNGQARTAAHGRNTPTLHSRPPRNPARKLSDVEEEQLVDGVANEPCEVGLAHSLILRQQSNIMLTRLAILLKMKCRCYFKGVWQEKKP